MVLILIFDLGGHTAEMLNLLSVLQINQFSPRFYIAAATDNMSLEKARVFENSLVDKVDFRVTSGSGNCCIIRYSSIC